MMNPDGQPWNEAERLAVVGLLSDLHLQNRSRVLANVYNHKFRMALLDLQRQYDPGPDWWVINGDICDHGLTDELIEFRESFFGIFPEFPRDHLLATPGNHEFLGNWDGKNWDAEHWGKNPVPAQLRPIWKVTFPGQELYTNSVIWDSGSSMDKGVHLVLLANEARSDLEGKKCWISVRQIAWFKKVLKEHQHLDTVVFMHQPLRNTVTPANSGHFLCPDQEKTLRKISGQNLQIKLWFSGHTHCRLVPDEIWQEGHVTFVGMGATSYMPDPQHGLSEDDQEFSQCRVLEIYPDRLRVRARNLISHEWMDQEVAVNRISAARPAALR